MKYHRFIHSQSYTNANSLSFEIFKNLTNSNLLITKIKINYIEILNFNLYRTVTNFGDESILKTNFDENSNPVKNSGNSVKDSLIVLQKNESLNLTFKTRHNDTNNVKFLVEIFYIDMDENK